MRTVFVMAVVLAVAVSARGEVFSSEFNAHPTEEGWELVPPVCGVSAAIENGHYVQLLDPQGCPDRAQEIYARTTGGFYGTAGQFLEFRVQTSGNLAGSCSEMPTQVGLNSFGFGSQYFQYLMVLSNDLVTFTDFSAALPLPFPLAPGAAHTVRLEWETPLGALPPIYRFFVDDVFVWSGAGWSFFDSTLLEWSGTSCQSPIENRWGYFRYGDIPADGSGDFDSDGLIDQRDYFFFHDCFVRRAPGQDDGPSCRFADMDGDTAVDLRDFADFQVRFMDPG